ncbi:MAG: UbiH/UbiF/VisC/COQ6 family ubiquinone biosynthesis hydroxylase [Gammaproteobacteria bacterium]|nr:UbiH/UbiF/VisC/COQ6 family ubiquinone biosynthesis hydroxylase [Gammaproteobacteria bacterium]
MNTPAYDLIIVGGGMVGATLACAVAPLGMRVVVVDAHPLPTWSPRTYDLRVSALTRASINILSHIGAWQGVRTRRVGPYETMRVWDAQGNGVIQFDAAESGVDVLGYIVENSVIQLALAERAQTFDNLHWRAPAHVQQLQCDDGEARLTLADGEVLHAPLIVGADGGSSWVRGQAGIATRGWDYAQHGVVATVRSARAHNATAWQRFLTTGPIAFLPLDDPHLCSIVWSAPSARAQTLLTLNDTAFNTELQAAFGDTLGALEVVGARAAHPLRLQYATHYARPRVVLIGDAAHNIHPLAGQGVNLGLLDAAALAHTLAEARLQRADYGELRVLRRYERWRKGENIAVMALMDGFKRLFGATATPLVATRNAGLNLLNQSPSLKNLITRAAMGARPDQPPLARNAPYP